MAIFNITMIKVGPSCHVYLLNFVESIFIFQARNFLGRKKSTIYFCYN